MPSTPASPSLSSTVASGAPSSADAPPVVVCQGLNKVFKDFWLRDHARAVQDLSLEIRPREVFGLLGPNGSGKSTTIKMILGLLRPTSGRVAVFGKSPSDVSIKKRIGYLPEESYMYGFLNARETLDYYGKLFELDAQTRARRIDELLDMLGLAGAQFRPVREYSKGMQRRLGIAQALINDPDFLILDEPTTGLDPIGTRQIKDLILELARRGKTVLLSSHLLADVEDCVDRLVILYGGRVRAEGTCDQLLVSQERTTIETDQLDEATIAEIDRMVRARTGGEKTVRKVAKPRQTLEALFLDIVERARAEQVTTSGATSGGQTAAFLREGSPDEGAALIDRLTSDQPAPAPAAAPRQEPLPMPSFGGLGSAVGASGGESASPQPSGTGAQAGDRGLIDALVSGQTPGNEAMARAARQDAPAPAPAAPQPKPQASVDASVIDALLGPSEGGKADSEKRS